MTCVYLLHIDPPFGRLRHYLGFTLDDDPCRRVMEHRRGRGSKLLRAATAFGCNITLVHFWAGGDRRFEAYLKNRRDTPRWCPKCGDGSRPLPCCVGYDAGTRTFHDTKSTNEQRKPRKNDSGQTAVDA